MKTIFTPLRTPPPKKINWHYDTYFIEQIRRINAEQDKKKSKGGGIKSLQPQNPRPPPPLFLQRREFLEGGIGQQCHQGGENPYRPKTLERLPKAIYEENELNRKSHLVDSRAEWCLLQITPTRYRR